MTTVTFIQDRRLFIDEQCSFDLAVACLQEAFDWESLRDALVRVDAFMPGQRLEGKRGGLCL